MPEVNDVPEAEFRENLVHMRTVNHPSHWPADVRVASLKGLTLLGLDSKGALYLDGEKVYTAKRWGTVERIIAILGVAAALIGASSTLFSAVMDYRAQSSLTTAEIEHKSRGTDAPLDLVLQVLEERADNSGAVALTYPHDSGKTVFMSAGGIPVQLGIRSIEREDGGYSVKAYLGNLSGVVIGGCNVEISLGNGSARYHSSVAQIDGAFGPGTAKDVVIHVTTDYPRADRVTMSKLRCPDAYYVDP